MADEYDPLDPPTFDAAAEDESYDPTEYQNYGQQDAGDEDDDYDPSSFNYGGDASEQPAEAQQNAPVATEQAPKQPQKVAGFIEEESDDEQVGSAPPPSQLNGTAGTQSGLGAVAVSEAQDVSLSSAPQDTAASSTSLNGSTTVHVPASTSSSLPDNTLQQPAPEQGKTMSPIASAQASIAPTPQPPTPAVAAAPQQTNGATLQPPARLPHDKVGQLEDRIKDDPKGDVDAWTTLIDHYVEKGQYDYARSVYDRFFAVFPTALPMWIKRLQMERELDDQANFTKALETAIPRAPSVELYKMYLDHVRRLYPLFNDTDGSNRQIVTGAFDHILKDIGTDPDAGLMWREYIDFLQEALPGTVGGATHADLSKADFLRKAYQRAIRIPHSESVKLWKEYEAFEMGLHKATGRKHIQDQSPYYVEARKAKVQLDQKLEGLDRKSVPRLPPIYGCAGEDEFGTQVEKWQGWIAWERDEDPLVLKGGEEEIWRNRVMYAYQQATMFLYFYPDIWFDAASWCFAQGGDKMTERGEKFLNDGIAANPESVLLTMMKADRVESSLESGNTDEVLIRNGEKLDVPYETLHTALYALRAKMVEKDKKAVAEIQAYYASLPPEEEQQAPDDDDDDESREKPQTREEQMKAQINAIKAASAPQLEMLKRTISYAWVAKMRAFRRVQGQGRPLKKGQDPKQGVKGFRGIFTEGRPRGSLSSDVYIASALMEWHCYKDPAATKIFERGYRLFPIDETFVLEYVKHLLDNNDSTNARVVFETTIPKILNNTELTQDQKRDKCRPLFVFMHDYEGKYGDLAQIHKLEKRMAELYPDEPEVSRFSHRFELPTFDAMHAQILISPTQAQPKPEIPVIAAPPQAMPTIEERNSPKAAPEILLGPNGPYVASPKRPLEDSDTDTPQRKFMRAESPLKGAAGMRMQGKATTTTTTGGGGGGFATKTFIPANIAAAQTGPTPLPPMVNWMLSILPNASRYNAQPFDGTKVVQFMQTVPVPPGRM